MSPLSTRSAPHPSLNPLTSPSSSRFPLSLRISPRFHLDWASGGAAADEWCRVLHWGGPPTPPEPSLVWATDRSVAACLTTRLIRFCLASSRSQGERSRQQRGGALDSYRTPRCFAHPVQIMPELGTKFVLSHHPLACPALLAGTQPLSLAAAVGSTAIYPFSPREIDRWCRAAQSPRRGAERMLSAVKSGRRGGLLGTLAGLRARR